MERTYESEHQDQFLSFNADILEEDFYNIQASRHLPSLASHFEAASDLGTSATVPQKGQLGHVERYNKQPKAKYLEGLRITENEHIIPRGNLEALTFNPESGLSDYDNKVYRNDATVRVEREMALNKTHKKRGGASADNARTKALKANAQKGKSINYRKDVFEASLENAIRSTKATNSEVPIEAINRAALEQDANLFHAQRLSDTSQKLDQADIASFDDFDWEATLDDDAPKITTEPAKEGSKLKRVAAKAKRMGGKVLKGAGKALGPLGTSLAVAQLAAAENQYDQVQASADLGADVAGYVGPVGQAFSAGYSAGQLLDQGVEELSGKSLSRRIADGLFSLFNSESDIPLTPKRGL